MAVHVGARGPGHLSRSGGFYPDAVLALAFTEGRYRVGAGSGSTGDFANLPGLTVSRASVGYAEQSDGTLVQFPTNTARITDKGLLVEEARTNLLLRSQEFDNPYWTKVDVTVTPNAIAAPDGTLTADMLTEGSAGTANTASGNPTITASVTTIDAIYLKRGNADWVRVRLVGTGGVNAVNAWFNLATGAVGTVNNAGAATGGAASIQALGGGWYRCVVSGVLSTDTTAALGLFSAASDGGARVPGATYYVWQADLNSNASFITSPVPTTSASATRAADDIKVAGMTIAAPFTLQTWASIPIIDGVILRLGGVNDGTTSNRVEIQRDNSNSASAFMVSGGVNQAAFTGGSFAGKTGARRLKMAARIRATTWNFAADNSLGTESVPVTIPTGLNTVRLGAIATGSSNFLSGYLELVTMRGDTSDVQFTALTS